MINKFPLIMAVIMLAGCASSAPEPIMTDEKFDSRIVDDGTIEFVYGVSWRNTSEASLISNNTNGERSKPQRDERDNGRFGPSKFAIQADNETKLALEDKAAASLQKRLDKEHLCPKGHQINQVIWQADNISLLGNCL